ncbi:MAG: tetraacyldisaccharide 4'-kinase [Nitrospira bacterium HGW-Nitrospira-1]|nr:MAG: tetraacyldisaccharide 4'-kinase [Nitrospira bacterium HGW-Nitrospira-1]
MGIPEFLYYIGLSAKRAYSLRHQKKLPYKVISVGNITVGGTGKTPLTIALAEEAKRRGFSPVVLTRGYKGSSKGPCFVTRGKGLLLNADEAGDEPVLMAERLKDVPIVKGGGRYEAGLFALQNFNSQLSILNSQLLFILDDGFQHWKLYRDKDILLIDSLNPFGNRALLPFGRLREPLGAMKRADIIVLTKCKDPGGMQGRKVEGIIAEIKKYNGGAPVFLSGHSMVTASLQTGEEISLDRLKDRKVFGFCALGGPGSFKGTIAETGAVITGFRTFRDHYKYSREDMARIKLEAGASGAEWIVTTEKDMIKIRDLDLPENIIIIGIDFLIDKGFYDAVFAL